MVFQAITGAQTPACLLAASDPVETVTPPYEGRISCDSLYYRIFGEGRLGPRRAGLRGANLMKPAVFPLEAPAHHARGAAVSRAWRTTAYGNGANGWFGGLRAAAPYGAAGSVMENRKRTLRTPA